MKAERREPLVDEGGTELLETHRKTSHMEP